MIINILSKSKALDIKTAIEDIMMHHMALSEDVHSF